MHPHEESRVKAIELAIQIETPRPSFSGAYTVEKVLATAEKVSKFLNTYTRPTTIVEQID